MAIKQTGKKIANCGWKAAFGLVYLGLEAVVFVGELVLQDESDRVSDVLTRVDKEVNNVIENVNRKHHAGV